MSECFYRRKGFLSKYTHAHTQILTSWKHIYAGTQAIFPLLPGNNQMEEYCKHSEVLHIKDH